jgi:hypothetical protein
MDDFKYAIITILGAILAVAALDLYLFIHTFK